MKNTNTGWGKVATVEQLSAMANKKNASTDTLNAGTHSTTIVARMEDVNRKLNDFYAKMERKYPTFEVIDTTSVSNWKNIQIYVTYRI